VSGVFVLDEDGIEGAASLLGKEIPKTVTVRTPRGGRHYYFKWTEELDRRITTNVGILDKVDTRGDGGFVVFYGWEIPPVVVPMAAPPDWLLELLPFKDRNRNVGKPVSEADNWLGTKLAGIKEGNRNASFASVAGLLRDKGFGSDEIFELLKPKAREVEFSDDELLTVCRSIGRYAPKNAPVTVDDEGGDIDEFLADAKPVEWLVPQVIARNGITFTAGLPETGKTWILIDLAVEVARGGLWLDKFPVSMGKALFLDQERGKDETARRFKAVLNAKGLTGSDLKGRLYVKSGTTYKLDNDTSFEALKRYLSKIKPNLIVMDSFVTFHDKEENNRKDIQPVLERVKALRNEFNCAIVFVDHENKGAFHDAKEGEAVNFGRMAGSVAKPAACEHVLTLRREQDASMVYVTKNTQAPKIAPFLVRVLDLDDTKSKIKITAK
jgi:hypothetical protein